MAKGILGRKVGMTQLFADNGELIPVTVIQAEGNVVLQKKTEENDGYNAIQIGFTDKKKIVRTKLRKVMLRKRARTLSARSRNRNVNLDEYEVGQDLSVDVFEAGEKVNVTGTSKGKGFQGSIKRHNQSRGPMTHGSHYHPWTRCNGCY